ncbi:MAG: suppressor of fused domain protein [Bdellovibrionaceae bacterium]|nr:suppressor of fused domain protein [Pseudobdellovibrionaceae bacterium]
MRAVTEDDKKIAKTVLSAFKGGSPVVRNYFNDSHDVSVDILSVVGTPDVDISSYGTIGLSDYPMLECGKKNPTRLELCGAALSSFTLFPNILSEAAFTIIKSSEVWRPGHFLKNIVGHYELESSLRSLYFTTPFFWEEDLHELNLNGKAINWLMCFPISDAELGYLEKYGEAQFENMLEAAGVNVFDTSRSSCV